MITRLLLLLPLLTFGTVGCALKRIDLQEPPPSLAYEKNNGKANIVVVRKGITAFAVFFGVYINGLHVGDLFPNDVVHHEVEPGVVEMFAGSEKRSWARFPVEANREYYLRTHAKSGVWFARAQLAVIDDPEKGREWAEKFDDKTFDEPRPFEFEYPDDE